MDFNESFKVFETSYGKSYHSSLYILVQNPIHRNVSPVSSLSAFIRVAQDDGVGWFGWFVLFNDTWSQ